LIILKQLLFVNDSLVTRGTRTMTCVDAHVVFSCRNSQCNLSLYYTIVE